MILAAGRGTRLGDLSQTTPKVLVEVAGEPMLARQIRYLKRGGVERIVVNAHHLADQVERFAAAHECAGDIDVVVEERLLGTAGGVRGALTLLGEDFLVLYGDVLVDEPIERMLDTHARLGGACTIAVYPTDDVFGKGTVEIDRDGAVLGFHEKAVESVAAMAYVNAGLYAMQAAFLAELPNGVPLDFGHDVFPDALSDGTTLFAHVLAAPVIDMGTPDALERARQTAATSASVANSRTSAS